jgi:phytoene dehydrogenase-like protein
LLEITVPSVRDASLAEGGREVVHVWVQYAAGELRESTWAEQGPQLGQLVGDMLEEHAPGFAASVLWCDVQTPADLERRFGLSGGCLYQAELALDQLLYMRPLPGWYDYETPAPGLYLCGAGTHGGGGVSGVPGRNAAHSVLEAL